MDGLSRLAASPALVELQHLTVLLPPVRLIHLGILENFLLARKRQQKISALMSIIDLLPADQREAEFFAARDAAEKISTITEAELLAWITATDEGRAYLLWVLLHLPTPSCPCPSVPVDDLATPSDVERFLDRLHPDEVAQLDVVLRMLIGIDAAHTTTDWPKKKRKAAGKAAGRAAEAGEQAAKQGQAKPPQSAAATWRLLFHRLTTPGWQGGRGFSPEQVKNLTLYEARLYASDPKSLGGSQKLKADEARELIGESRDPNQPVVKWADVGQRERELYEKRWGVPMPESCMGSPDEIGRKRMGMAGCA